MCLDQEPVSFRRTRQNPYKFRGPGKILLSTFLTAACLFVLKIPYLPTFHIFDSLDKANFAPQNLRPLTSFTMSHSLDKRCPQQLPRNNLLAGGSSTAAQLTKGDNDDGLTPLHLAARSGTMEAVGTILDDAAEIGTTSLDVAHRRALEWLLTRLSENRAVGKPSKSSTVGSASARRTAGDDESRRFTSMLPQTVTEWGGFHLASLPCGAYAPDARAREDG